MKKYGQIRKTNENQKYKNRQNKSPGLYGASLFCKTFNQPAKQ